MNKLDRLRKVLAKIPSIECKGLCWDYCGVLLVTESERELLGSSGKCGKDNICPKLSLSNRCTVYENRPGICRLFGVSELLPCPHGCVAERMLSEKEHKAIVFEIEEIDKFKPLSKFA